MAKLTDEQFAELNAQFRKAKDIVRRMSKELQREPLSLMETAFVHAIFKGALGISIPVNYAITKEQAAEVLDAADSICAMIQGKSETVTIYKSADDEGTHVERQHIREEFGV